MFSIDNSISAGSNQVNHLEGNKIHTVTFTGSEAMTIEGKDAKYNVLKFKFKDADGGVYEETIFEPKAEDLKRKANNFGGENPAGVEQLMFKLRHVIRALNPELNAKIESGEKKLTAPSWDALRNLMVTATEKCVGAELQIKLLKDKNGRGKFPAFPLSISKKGELYNKTNFMGKDLTFTTDELKAISAAATAPTSMPSTPAGDLEDLGVNSGATPTGGKNDFDFDPNEL